MRSLKQDRCFQISSLIHDGQAKKLFNFLESIESTKEKRHKYYGEAFINACIYGQLHIVKKLIIYHVQLQARDSFGNTGLHIAAEENNILLYRELIKINNLSLNTPRKYDHCTPIHLAIRLKNLSILHELLQHPSFDPNVKEYTGYFCLLKWVIAFIK
mmetsp:Transcript_4978/g.7378  ORF Transcript_4978/g.7378 Transcript_4978/m.7378 type:complete len:158 (+) Transcript_4978:1012-1485(+)